MFRLLLGNDYACLERAITQRCLASKQEEMPYIDGDCGGEEPHDHLCPMQILELQMKPCIRK